MDRGKITEARASTAMIFIVLFDDCYSTQQIVGLLRPVALLSKTKQPGYPIHGLFMLVYRRVVRLTYSRARSGSATRRKT
jgi:hypothetical protein